MSAPRILAGAFFGAIVLAFFVFVWPYVCAYAAGMVIGKGYLPFEAGYRICLGFIGLPWFFGLLSGLGFALRFARRLNPSTGGAR